MSEESEESEESQEVEGLTLLAELARRSDVCWVRPAGGTRTYAVWHTWAEDSLCLVSGGDEQRLPDAERSLAHGRRAEVVMRSRDTGGRLLTWVGTVSVLRPSDDLWAPVTAALVASRLNLRDPATAADRWAEHSVVRRIVPTGELLESPTSLDDDAHRQAPPAVAPSTRRPQASG